MKLKTAKTERNKAEIQIFQNQLLKLLSLSQM